jgi:hypothetical protein
VFKTFGIRFGNLGVNTNCDQKIPDNRMPFGATFGKLPAFFCQKDRTVGLGYDQPFSGQSLNGGIYGRRRHPKAGGQINRTGLTGFGNEVGDHLNVIFRHLTLVRTADPLKSAGAFISLGLPFHR